MDNTLPYLFYTNVKTTVHNKNVFWNTLGETLTFLTHDLHTETCPFHFKLSNLPFQTTSSHYKILVKKNVNGIMKHLMVLWMVLMGFSKILQKLFQNLLFGCIFIILQFDIIHKLKIYKFMVNFQGLTNNGHQLNVKLSKYK
jgi:hypothetical protein